MYINTGMCIPNADLIYYQDKIDLTVFTVLHTLPLTVEGPHLEGTFSFHEAALL
jgi:hypothetical protein